MPRIIAALLLLCGWIAVPPAQADLVTGHIKVTSVSNQNTIGFLQLTAATDRYIAGSASTADNFQLDTSASAPFTLLDQTAPASHPFFAGLLSPGIELLTTNANAAVLGDSSVQTAPGSTPQTGGSPSIPGAEFETAIWSRSNNDLSLRWVNHDGSQPSVSVVWDPVGQVLYLTANPAAVILNHPGSQTVQLAFIETGTLPPPCTSSPKIDSLSASPNVLWPPNSKLVPVTVSPSTSGGCAAVSCKIISVSSSDPPDAQPDWVITGNLTLQLRATRLETRVGTNNGRVYTITVQCSDGTNSTTKTTTVRVPHDQGHGD
jgi:hypothetical protein